MPKFIPNTSVSSNETDEVFTLEFSRVPKAPNSYMYYTAPNGDTVVKTAFSVGEKIAVKRDTLFVIWTPTMYTATKSFFTESIALEGNQNAGSGISRRYTYIFRAAYAEPIVRHSGSTGETI